MTTKNRILKSGPRDSEGALTRLSNQNNLGKTI